MTKKHVTIVNMFLGCSDINATGRNEMHCQDLDSIVSCCLCEICFYFVELKLTRAFVDIELGNSHALIVVVCSVKV